jgi:hypothetical protein
MRIRWTGLSLLAAIATCGAGVAAGEELEQVRLVYETNATDGDAEVVMEIDAGAELRSLEVQGPKKRRILRVHANDFGRIGLAKITVESGEPSPAEVQTAYPAGEYVFKGRTVDGEVLASRRTLSHDVLPAPAITFPVPDAIDVPVDGAVGTWTTVAGSVAYAVELDNEDTEEAVTIDLPPTATSFPFPAGWLTPGTTYQFGVAAIAANGNVTVSEVQFRTGD